MLVDARPRAGGRNRTPARRAFESPIAIACLVDRAPCLPWRMWCISSRTNSPAWVEGAVQTSLNAVWGILHHLGGTTHPDNLGPGDVFARLAPLVLPD